MQRIVRHARGHFHKLQAIFAGVIQHVAHHFEKIVFLADKHDLRRDIERNAHAFALVHFVQRRGQVIEQRRHRVQLAAQHHIAAAHAGAVQVVANLLRDAAYLLKHHRLGLFDGGFTGTQRAQRTLQHRQRRFQAVGEVRERGAVFLIALALAFQQSVKVMHEACQLAGRVGVELFAVMFFEFAHFAGQRLNRAQAPPGGEPQQRNNQQQIRREHIDKPVPDAPGAFQLVGNGVDHDHRQRGHSGGRRVDIHRHRVRGLVIAVGIVIVQTRLQGRVSAQQHTGIAKARFQLVKAVGGEPFRADFFQ
ncbi:hypothetical protein BN133_325 [Cronobacter dublinensis 582]|nr:hypothetical protein BN133_325 [Cronobacter dublinensis 582]